MGITAPSPTTPSACETFETTPPPIPKSMKPVVLNQQERFPNSVENNQLNSYYQRYSKVVCRVETTNPANRGSGSIILGNLLLTNWHVLHVLKDPDAKSHACFFKTLDQNSSKTDIISREVKIELDPTACFLYSKNNWQGRELKPADEAHLDFVIVALKKHDYLKEIENDIFDTFGVPKENKLAAVIHYPEIEREDVRNNHGYIHQVAGHSFCYDTETAPGSSGGAIINIKGKFLGVHYQTLERHNPQSKHPYCNSAVKWSSIKQQCGQELKTKMDKAIEIKLITKDHGNGWTLFHYALEAEQYDVMDYCDEIAPEIADKPINVSSPPPQVHPSCLAAKKGVKALKWYIDREKNKQGK